MTDPQYGDTTADRPARNGLAAEVIARNAAEGAAQKGPAMAESNDEHETLAQQIRYAIADQWLNETDPSDTVAAYLLDRYELTPRTRPSDERLDQIVNSAYAAMTTEKTAAKLIELLADDGFEIRPLVDGTFKPVDPS